MQSSQLAERSAKGKGTPVSRVPSSALDRARRGAPNKHQQRTEETRRKLLRAAEKVFAKVGFEAARLEDIAQEAGHTRGAFYAHFSKKEDLFFALLEQQAHQHLTAIQAITEECGDDGEKKLRCIRDYYSSLAANRNWSMLMLEFKLFAVRHPRLRKKLAGTHRQIRSSFRGEGVNWTETNALPRGAMDGGRKTRIALEALLHGLVLESDFDPLILPKGEAAWMLRRVFDLLTGACRE